MTIESEVTEVDFSEITEVDFSEITEVDFSEVPLSEYLKCNSFPPNELPNTLVCSVINP